MPYAMLVYVLSHMSERDFFKHAQVLGACSEGLLKLLHTAGLPQVDYIEEF